MRGYDTCHASFHFRAFPWLLDLGQTPIDSGPGTLASEGVNVATHPKQASIRAYSAQCLRTFMRVSGTCRKLPGIRRPANTAVGSTAAPANAAGNSRTTAASDSRRAAGEARTGPARSLVTRGGRIPAAPRGGNASSAKVSAGAAHERVSDQAAGRAALGPLAAGRLHASSGTQVSWAQGGGTWDSSSEPRLAALRLHPCT